MVRKFATLGHMEVCRISCRQTLSLDPIASHFLDLETAAARLAQVLLVTAIERTNMANCPGMFDSLVFLIFARALHGTAGPAQSQTHQVRSETRIFRVVCA